MRWRLEAALVLCLRSGTAAYSGNNRMLLELSQAALRDSPLGSSTSHVAFLERQCRNAEAHLVESEHEPEKVLEYICNTA